MDEMEDLRFEEYKDNYLYEKAAKFNKFEKIFVRIELGIALIGVLLFILFNAAMEVIGYFADAVISFLLFLWVVIILNFIISIVRIFKYLFSKAEFKKETSIWRSIITFFTSPIVFALVYLLIFIASISGCVAGSL